MRKYKSKVIIIIGPPGSGKGTQATLLADRLGLFYFETSRIIEPKIMGARPYDYVIIEGRKYYLKEEKKKWESGELWSPPFVTYWVQEKIKELAEKEEGIVFAGSPRTLYEAERIMPLLNKLYGKKNIKIILFTLSAKTSIFRNSHRRICELLRHPILYNEETKNLTKCPLDGSKLIRRKKLDDPETIKIRIKEYKERTLPIIDYFKKKGYKVKKISAAPPPAVIFRKILNYLSKP
ncbi:MAG: nucleoside monophosphate kinase [Candidatus Pacebacteria bacterium]|nr:nucleoside monophosphate kinase [Candidatus Paceibacterota bacterium]